jgi:hypothetical protein
MMTTEQQYQQAYQRLRNMGMSDEAARSELQLQLNFERAQAEAAERAKAKATAPVERRPAEWEIRLADEERRWAAHWNASSDPLRIAQEQAEEQRLVAAITALDQQLLPLQKQRQALADQLARLRFQG